MTSPARPAVGAEAGGVRAVPIEPPADALVVDAPGPGWVQQISSQALRDALGEGQTVRLDVAVGSFVAEGTPLGHLWPPPDDEAETVRRIRRAFALGNERTLQQDVGLGLVRLGDIALRALSPSLNDPNTADEVIVRLGAVVREILLRELPSPVEEWEGRTIVRIHDVDHGDYVRRAFDQIRLGAASHPYVLATLVRTLGMLAKECERHGVPDRRQYLVAQVEAVQATLDRSLPEGDRRLVHQAVEESRLVDPARIADSS
ncbi:MAG TPA: DUF2254 family protein [Acidimicrobiia bacterium]|nr:DUF2254 family protein [Acidimicrobiia bacterium]